MKFWIFLQNFELIESRLMTDRAQWQSPGGMVMHEQPPGRAAHKDVRCRSLN
jgi:hypothetical protein